MATGTKTPVIDATYTLTFSQDEAEYLTALVGASASGSGVAGSIYGALRDLGLDPTVYHVGASLNQPARTEGIYVSRGPVS